VNDGVYKVNFTAVDDDGARISMDLVVTILNTAPVPRFTISPVHGNTSTIFTFNSTSQDTDGIITNYTWDLGDGNVSYGTETVSHQYTVPGNYTVILRIWDDDNEMMEFKLYLKVDKVPEPPPSPDTEPEIPHDTNRSKDRNEENELALELLIFGIIIMIVIIVIIVIFLFVVRKKRAGGEGHFHSSEDDLPGMKRTEIKPDQSRAGGSELEIEWDDEY